MIQKFWKWYQDNLHINQAIVAVLFIWQVLHLYWLTTHVVAERVLGYSVFNPTELYQFLLIIADYIEIPALISGTLLYFHLSKERRSFKNILFIVLINSQWLHLFWITDEFAVSHFRGEHSYFPPTPQHGLVWGLAWLAIFIDYLELPVIYDSVKRTALSLLKRG